VQIEGDHKQGMIIDFADLKKQAKGVLEAYDHRSWNEFLEFPSVENICDLLSQKLAERLSFPFVLRVWEGHGKWAETNHPSK
jgi:6-pyruvoyltetrahydropterin/6-carboxytetrahydropterin synthase